MTMKREFGRLLLAGLMVVSVSAPVFATEIVASSSVVMKDAYNSKEEWGNNLVLPKEGKITRVMDGTYGFDIKTLDGVKVASFLDPQQAVGMSLPAGTYVIDPYVCKRHRHHHIEVSATY
ncbi:MAG: hypothetical protein ACOH12_02780 [Parvibaculaceae bacterium]